MDRRRLLVRVVVRPRVDGREVHEDGQDRAEQGADGYITHGADNADPRAALRGQPWMGATHFKVHEGMPGQRCAA
jgi:hypothetical protein